MKLGNILIGAAAAVFLGMAVYSGYNIISYELNAKNTKELYSNLSSNVNIETQTAGEVKTVGRNQIKNVENDVKIDMSKLMSANPNACGYIYMEDFISYPVMQIDSNSYYLNHDANGNGNAAGALFFDCKCNNHSSRLVIYGHNMLNGSMFGQLKKFADSNFFKRHEFFYLNIREKTYRCPVICATYTSAGSYMYDTEDVEFDDMKAFVDKIVNDSINKRNVKMSKNDGTLLLSTCTQGTGRMALLLKVPKLIENREMKMRYFYEYE